MKRSFKIFRVDNKSADERGKLGTYGRYVGMSWLAVRASARRTAATVYLYVLFPVRRHLPQPRGLDDLLDKLLERALHALACLCRRLDKHHLVLAGQLDALVLGNDALVQVALKSNERLSK